ncbi:MAG: glycerate kinase [Clostridiales bacterium]|nr:glycerate kinase [Clostridiales bacterium]
MKKIILIPDSFKGTMSSQEICAIMGEQIRKHLPDAEIVSIPVADGGEGSVDAFLTAMGGEKVELTVSGPYGEPVRAFYGRLPSETAIVEMAAAAGLPLVGDNKQADRTTTFGVGQLMAHAVRNGAKKLIVGLGGSATNDGGTGAAAALGVRFLNQAGEAFVPVGATLKDIARIDPAGLLPEIGIAEVVTMCDIDNPLCGPQGAAAVFGPQKGADPAMVTRLDAGLAHLADIARRDLGREIRDLPGAGAAGGMGGGMVAFFGSSLEMGIEAVLNQVSFDQLAADADLVLSGEGKIDSQSLRGKVVIGVARRTRRLNVPLIAVVGDIGDRIESAYEEGVSAIFSINRVAVPFSEARHRAQSDLALTVDNLFRLFQGMKGRI